TAEMLQVRQGAQFGGVGGAVGDERPVGEHVLDQADFPGPGGAEAEADGAGPFLHLGLGDHLPGARVGGVVDAGGGGARVDLGFIGHVGVHAAVPVEVVGVHVQ